MEGPLQNFPLVLILILRPTQEKEKYPSVVRLRATNQLPVVSFSTKSWVWFRDAFKMVGTTFWGVLMISIAALCFELI